jgi:hypothetical protein
MDQMHSSAEKKECRLPGDSVARATIFILSLVGVGLLGLIDCWTGYDLSFFVFYFAPVALVAWRLGAIPAYVIAGAGGLAWLLSDFYSGHRYTTAFYPYWNTGLRILSFVIIAYSTDRIRRLQEETEKVARHLSGLLPICAWCKRIRNDAGYWEQVEQYLAKHSDAAFTHSICEDCARREVEETRLVPKDSAS